MSYNYEKAFSLEWNGQIFILTNRFTDTSGNILYSYDAQNWISSNPTNIENPLSVKWVGQKYILDTSNTLFNSIDGIHWTNNTDISNTAIYDIETNLEQVNTITFPQNITLALGSSNTCTIGVFDNSACVWNFSNNSISVFSNTCNDAIWNGKIWIAVGNGINSIATSQNGIHWVGRGSSIFSSGNAIRWNRKTSLIVATGNGGIAYSYDGIYWKLNTIFTNAISIECNETMWVSTGSNESNETIAYSYNGIDWDYAVNSFDISSNKIIWNGSFWVIIGQNTAGNNIATSQDGINWIFSTILNGTHLHNVIYNSLEQITFFVDSTNNLYETKTNDFSNLSLLTTSVSNLIYNGNYYLFGSQNIFQYSPDIEFTSLYKSGSFDINNPAFTIHQFAWNYPNIGSSAILPMTIAVGSGDNTIGYSYDGIKWYGNGNSIFTNHANQVIWNGHFWSIVGSGSNGWIATSLDGILWKIRDSIIMTEGMDIAWNGHFFIAVGQNEGQGIIAISYDGISWDNIPNTLFTIITKVVWTGYIWVIYGVSSTNNVATSIDGINWSTMNISISNFSNNYCPIVTNQHLIIQTSITDLSVYDLNGTFITNMTFSFAHYISSVCFDGENYILFDTNGGVYYLSNDYIISGSLVFQSFLGSSNLTTIYDSTYNGKFVMIGGDTSITYNKFIHDGSMNFTNVFSHLFSSIYGIESNSGYGFVYKPNLLYFKPNEKLSIITPKFYTDSIIPPTNITMNIYDDFI